jgi:hypothetical protein
VVAIIFYTGCLKKRPTLLAIPAISETSGVNCMQNFKHSQTGGYSNYLCLIEIYYLKMSKNKTDKISNTCRKNEPEACF